MSGVTADIPAAPDEPSGQATGNTSVASAHTSDEAAQASESTQHSKNIPTEDVLNFIYGRSSSTDKPCNDVKSDDLDPYMTFPRATLGSTAQTPHDTPQDPKSSFASFGDRGTTASVNAYGQIMQITKFLGTGRSGFLCTDRQDMPEPFFVQWRAERLMEMSSNYLPDCGFTLLGNATPQLDFVCDRWPRFTGNVDGYIVQIQYYASHGKIFQQCILEKNPMQESPEFRDWFKLTLPPDELFILDSDVHIRDLDWQDIGYPFNYSPYGYDTHLDNDGFSLVRTHTGLDCEPLTDGGSDNYTDDTKPLGSTTAELVITAFLNSRPQRLKSLYEDGSNYCIDIPRETAIAEFSKRGRLEITVTYSLQLAQKDGIDAWKSRLVAASHLTHMREACSTRGFRDIRFSTSSEIDFAIRRNLEHILSVCCIPVPTKRTQDSRNDVIALTCGDMSGHRLVNSASFFSFEFLVAMHEFLQKELSIRGECQRCGECQEHHPGVATMETSTKDQKSTLAPPDSSCQHWKAYYVQVRDLASRIHDSCKGHINWVFNTAQANETDGQTFGPNYWASGCRIKASGGRASKSSSPEFVTDGAFQLIKVERFHNMSGEESADSDLPQQWIDTMVDRWFAQLKKAEKNPRHGRFAFARSTDDVTGRESYYLEDHVWIWRALASIESIGQSSGTQDKNKSLSSTRATGSRHSSKRYSSAEAQGHILKRFTTENPALKRRMLATFRSSSESRFMLRSRDTALFHAMDSKFFSIAGSNSLIDVWRATLEAQSIHEQNQTALWISPLRYALSLLMAIKDFQINRSSAKECFYEAKTVLLGSSWANGLFPGALDPVDKYPAIFHDVEYRDTYWHITFEIPYVLWIHAKEITDYNADISRAQQLPEDSKERKPDHCVQEAHTTQDVVVTTKDMPFNNIIDQRNIVEVPEEWLYHQPDFLTFTSGLDDIDPLNGSNNLWTSLSFFEKKLKALCIVPEVSDESQFLYACVQLISTHIHSNKDTMFVNLLKILERVCMTHWVFISQQDSTKDVTPNHFSEVLLDIHATIERCMFLWVPEKWEEDMKKLLKLLFRVAANPELESSWICAAMSRTKEMTPPMRECGSSPRGQSAQEQKGAIVDVEGWTSGRWKRVGLDPLKEARMLTNNEILRMLRTRRPPSDDKKLDHADSQLGIIKKRLVWLPCADMDTVMTCYYSTPLSERENMLSFFERHATYDKFFFDGITTVLNTWKTELHLSFYQLHAQDRGYRSQGILKPTQIRFPSDEADKSIRYISRATMGFRFDGDFLDRYWTCHFIENKPKKGEETKVDITELSNMLQPQKLLPKDERRNQPWRQRKVLELILFDKVLEEITSSTEEIMKTIRNELKSIRYVSQKTLEGNNHDSSVSAEIPRSREADPNALEDAVTQPGLVKMKGDVYQRFSKKSKALEQILRVLDDDLGENYEHFEKWRTRDKNREPQQPRWSRNNEKKYRTTIIKMSASNDRRIKTLERCRSNVRSLRASLESTREYVRDDLNLRSAEDVRLFTYVTATFLPISFATSVFSMGGFPGRTLLGSMIGVATVALLLTGIAIAHDKTLASGARYFKRLVGGESSNDTQSLNCGRSAVTGNAVGNESEELMRTGPSSGLFRRFRGKARGDLTEVEDGVRRRRP